MAAPPRSSRQISVGGVSFGFAPGYSPSNQPRRYSGGQPIGGFPGQPGSGTYPVPTATPFTSNPGGGGQTTAFPNFNPGGSGGGGLPSWEEFFGGLARRGGDWLAGQLFGGGSGGSGSGALPSEGSTGCAPGYAWNASTGQCEQVGVSGGVRRFLPGGASGTQADMYGNAVVGAFGTPALVPAVVGQIQDSNGMTKPIQRCPPGAVLGKDNLCYMKGSIPMKFRKWRPSPKPPMSAADAKALRRIGTLQKKVKRLAGNAGLSCRKR